MQIKRWIRIPDAFTETDSLDEIMDDAGILLDKSYSHEIIGECLFEGDDGKFYVGTVEFVIAEANPDYVKQTIAEEESHDQ